MPKPMIQVHEEGGHVTYPSKLCPLCIEGRERKTLRMMMALEKAALGFETLAEVGSEGARECAARHLVEVKAALVEARAPIDPKIGQPNKRQLDALYRYMLEHGRTWKSDLGGDWLYARARTRVPDDAPLLQQVRNDFGPSWLVKFAFPSDYEPPCDEHCKAGHSIDCDIRRSTS